MQIGPVYAGPFFCDSDFSNDSVIDPKAFCHRLILLLPRVAKATYSDIFSLQLRENEDLNTRIRQQRHIPSRFFRFGCRRAATHNFFSREY
jgi:hypothetical protein